MYRKIRAVHRYCALATLPFLLVYFVSAVLMAHRTWWPSTPVKSTGRVQLSKELADGRAVAQELMKRGDVDGELLFTAAGPLGIRCTVARPGVSAAVSYSPQTGVADVVTSQRGWSGALADLHKTAGFAYRYATLRVWAMAAAAVSAILLLLGLSGLYLWYRQTSERRAGLVLLSAASVAILYLMISMRV